MANDAKHSNGSARKSPRSVLQVVYATLVGLFKSSKKFPDLQPFLFCTLYFDRAFNTYNFFLLVMFEKNRIVQVTKYQCTLIYTFPTVITTQSYQTSSSPLMFAFVAYKMINCMEGNMVFYFCTEHKDYFPPCSILCYIAVKTN